MTVSHGLRTNLMIKPHSSKGDVVFSDFTEFQDIYKEKERLTRSLCPYALSATRSTLG